MEGGASSTHAAIQLRPEHADLPSCAAKSSEIYLKQLHSNHSEHELQEVGNQHDIADRLNGYYHAFHYILAIGRFGMKE